VAVTSTTTTVPPEQRERARLPTGLIITVLALCGTLV